MGLQINFFLKLASMIGSFRLLKHVKYVKCVNKTHRLFSSKAIFKDVPQGPPDAILGLTTAWRNDPNTEKLNLGVGAYRDDNGKPFVLDCVRKAEKALLDQNLDMEYAGIDGVPTFRKVASELAYGKDSKALETLTCSQTLSGTGALRLAGEFLNRFGKGRSIYLPTPTWGNHIPIFRDSGLEVKQYRYYDAKTCGLDFDGMLQDIQAAPKGQIFLFHACAHNPTGVDPTPEQWREISNVVKAADQFVVVDMAYQGFASGDPERDATALQTFVGDQHNLMLCQSFAKNFGLYGQRTGMLSYVANDTDERDRVESQFKILIRPMYSNPPIHGARIVSHILSDKQLSAQWRDEVRLMADRIHGMRAALRSALEAHGSTRDWSHIEQQIGMFCYSGLSQAHVEQLKADYSVYLTSDGRISMAGVTSHNVERLAYCIHQVTK